MKPLTVKQVECLRDAKSAADSVPLSGRTISGWDYGSTTIAVLKKLGFLYRAYEAGAARYFISDAGREALKGAR